MAKLFLITYDLHSPEQNYSGLYETIKEIGYSWVHPLESIWVVRTLHTQQSAESIYKKLRGNIDNDDSLFVVEITDCDRQGWLPKSFWKWLNN